MKKFLAICLVLVTVLAIALPSMVLADNTTINGHVVSRPVVTHVYLTGGTNPGKGTPSAGAPSSAVILDIDGTDFDNISGDPVPTVTTSAGANITVTSVSIDSDTLMHATFTVAAATTSGPYDVQVTQGGLTSVVSSPADNFVVGSYGTVTTPSISMGLISVGTDKIVNGNGGLVTNDTTWAMTVKDNSNLGFMKSGGTSLTDKCKISKDSTPADFVVADTGLTAGSTYINSGDTLPLYVSQKAELADSAGTYSITITFTYSPTY
jgi:hypothetical protein